MKNLILLFCFAFFMTPYMVINAQESAEALEVKPQDYKKRSPIYDYSEKKLNNTDTLPDFAARKNKLKIEGTIYESDGVTPASNVLLFICQSDEDGNYELKRYNKKRYVHHRGWIRTDKDGHYTFYTFIPGKYIYGNEPIQIHPIIKEPNKPEYRLESFLFENDPLLTEKRSKIKHINTNRILKLDKKEGLYVAKRDIILGKEVEAYN